MTDRNVGINSNAAATSHGMSTDAIGLVGANLHGSLPYLGADQSFEPNFRHFDLYYNQVDTPDEDLMARLYKSEAGEERYDLRTFYGARPRAVPVVISSMGGGAIVAYVYTRLWGRTGGSMRFAFAKCYAAVFLWNNFTKWYGRERHFMKDFKRNQAYAQDELRYLRDKQRVRETLYLKKFVDNPIAEYRVKAWQIADRFA
jgi:hypothetical protein